MNENVFARAAVLLAAGLIASACDADSAVEATSEARAELGVAGGRLFTDDGGLVLEVPQNALDDTVTLTATPVDAPDGGVPGTAYDLGPHGTRFEGGARMSVRYDPEALDEGVTASDLTLVHVASDGAVEAIPGSVVDPAAATVSGPFEHFSGVFVFQRQRTCLNTPPAPPQVARVAARQFSLSAPSGGASTQLEVAVHSRRTWPHEAQFQRHPTARGSGWQLPTYIPPCPDSECRGWVAFRVRTVCPDGRLSVPSTYVVHAINNDIQPPPAPSWPGPASAEASGPSQIWLRWSYSEWATSYVIDRETSPNAWTHLATLPGTDHWHSVGSRELGTLEALSPQTRYRFRVRGEGPSGASNWAVAEVTTPAVGQPGTAGRLVADVDRQAPKVTLRWSPASFIEAQRVEREPAAGGPTEVLADGLSAVAWSFEDVNVEAGEVWRYRVVATAGADEGAPAEVVAAIPQGQSVVGPGASCADVSLTVTPSPLALVPHTVTRATVQVTRLGGFSGEVQLGLEASCEAPTWFCEYSGFCEGDDCIFLRKTLAPGESAAELGVYVGAAPFGTTDDLRVYVADAPSCEITVPLRVVE